MTYDTINDTQTIVGGDSVLGRIDQYELVRELGGGGFGTVYLARDTVAGIEVAVKGLPPIIKNNAEELENIRANFALVSRLHHPYIAAALHLQLAREVYYASEDVRQKLRVESGDTLMVMEYAPGVTLSKWRRQFPGGNIPLEQAIQLVWQIAQARQARARRPRQPGLPRRSRSQSLNGESVLSLSKKSGAREARARWVFEGRCGVRLAKYSEPICCSIVIDKRYYLQVRVLMEVF